MSHLGFTQRRLIRFPNAVDGNLVGAGIPGPAADGGFSIALTDEAAITLANLPYLAEQASVKLTIPPTGMPVRWIGIDPESAIACCDIAWSGRNGELERRRISPGNPAFINGCETSPIDFAMVSIPWSLPLLPTAEFDDAGAASIAAHDYINLSPSVPSEYSSEPGWPLRLEIAYGDVPPMRTHRRAPYCAHFITPELSGTDSIDSREFLICVDGRRRVDVYAIVVGGAGVGGSITLECFDHVGWKSSDGLEDMGSDDVDAVVLPLDDLGTTVATLVGGSGSAPQCFSFDGNPMAILRCRITINWAEAGPSTAQVQLKIRAED